MKALVLTLGLGVMAAVGVSASVTQIGLNDGPTTVEVLQEDPGGFTLNIRIGEINLQPIEDGDGSYVAADIEGFTRASETGKPALPLYSRMVSIPFESAVSVSVENSVATEISLDDLGISQQLAPAPAMSFKGVRDAGVTSAPEKAVYDRDEFYSLPTATAEITGVMRAVRLARLTVAPVEYNPKQNTLRVYSDITVRVQFEHPNWDLTRQMRRDLYSPYFEAVYARLLNEKSDPPVGMDLVREPVKYVIIAHSSFRNNDDLDSLIEWKTLKGFDVITKYTDEPEIGSTGGNINSYLSSFFPGSAEDPAPSFVLFVGDVAQITPPASVTFGGVSDLLFCEFTGDVYPELYYGRFSAETYDELEAQVQKTIEYEMFGWDGSSYAWDNYTADLNTVALVAGDDGRGCGAPNGQVAYAEENYFSTSNGFIPESWSCPGSVNQETAIKDGIQDAGIVYYTGHGEPGYWNGPIIDADDIANFAASDIYSLVIANACETGRFAYTTDCIGEAWMHASHKAAVGYIGAFAIMLWEPDFWWWAGASTVSQIDGDNPGFNSTGSGALDALFHNYSGYPQNSDYFFVTNDAIIYSGNLAVEEAFIDQGNVQFIETQYGAGGDADEIGPGLTWENWGEYYTHWYWESYHLLGDPSVCTYLGAPAENTVVVDPVHLGATSVSVQAAPGSYVSLTRDGVIHGIGYLDPTDAAPGTGEIDISIPFTGGCEATIVVTAQNYKPYFGTVCLSNNVDHDNDGVGNSCDLDYQVCGDADASGQIDLDDSYYIMDYIFSGGCPPVPELAAGEVNCDGLVNVGDIVYLSNYLLHQGSAPCDCQAKRVASPDVSAYLYTEDKDNQMVLTVESPVPLGGLQFELNGVPEHLELNLIDNAGDLHEVATGDRRTVGIIGQPKITAASGQTHLLAVPVGTTIESAVAFGADGREISVVLMEPAQKPQLPADYSLSQNYPNPFNPATEISFGLPSAGPVRLEVFNVLGQRVAVLLDEPMEAGYHSVSWDGSSQATGMYMYRLTAGEYTETRKMLLIK